MWAFWDSFELGYSAHISINYFGDAQFGIPKLLQDWQMGWTHLQRELSQLPRICIFTGFLSCQCTQSLSERTEGIILNFQLLLLA